MTFSKKKLPKSQIALEVQLAAEELEKKRQEAIAGLAKDLRVEGFRPGHVPAPLAEKHLGEAHILEESARLAITEAWIEIIRQENLDVLGEPEIQLTKLAPGNPLEFRVQVAVLPDIELPDYQKIAQQSSRKKVVVEEQEIDQALEWLRESRKTRDGATPEITNEFAQGLGNFKDLESLRESVREGLLHEKEAKETERLRQEIIEKVAEHAKLEIPDVLIEREKRVLLSQIKQGVAQMMGISFDEYLEKAKKTEQELLDSFAKEAEQRVKRFLVVRGVAKKEGIGPTSEEIEEEARTIEEHYKDARGAGQKLDRQRLREYTEGVLRHEKTLQFLEKFTII
ncbi:MAG TPA: trigger factor [Candidatus Paceibacterota bacterium]